MKRKLYTLSHDNNLLKEIDNNGGIFTSQEHASVMEKEFGETFWKSKEHLLRHSLQDAFWKIGQNKFFIDLIKNNDYQNILSLGSGGCVIEYLLKLSLPETLQVIAYDFDSFVIKKAKEFFPELIVEQFDHVKEDIGSFQNKLNIEFDCAIFFSSAYIMDDKEFIKLFGDLKKIGVKNIIDFHDGYLDSWDVLRHLSNDYLIPETIRTNYYLRKILRKPTLPSGYYRGKFHGYSRSRGELRKLYKKSGLKIQKQISTGEIKYIAILG